MCFTYEVSVCLSLYGCAISYYFYYYKSPIFYTVGYFTLMEILQTIQYYVVADNLDSPQCLSFWNKFLTTLGFIHICYQPYFINYHTEINDSNHITKPYFVIIKRFCLVGGTMLLFRHFQRLIFDESYENYIATEWLNGNRLCTYRGNIHFAWSVPMTDVSYYLPSSNIHFFLFFVPQFVIYEHKRWIIKSFLMILTRPIFASYMTSNLQEIASIWCFVSVLLFTSTFIKDVYKRHIIARLD